MLPTARYGKIYLGKGAVTLTDAEALRKQIRDFVNSASLNDGCVPPCTAEDIDRVVDRLVPGLDDILGDIEGIL